MPGGRIAYLYINLKRELERDFFGRIISCRRTKSGSFIQSKLRSRDLREVVFERAIGSFDLAGGLDMIRDMKSTETIRALGKVWEILEVNEGHYWIKRRLEL